MRPAVTVLVVEDDPVLQRSLRRELERRGFSVRIASDSRGAMEVLGASPPADVICVDLCLPDKSGYELCEQIRAMPQGADVPILAVSDATFPEHMAHAQAAGADAFLKKPFAVETLARCIQSLVDRAPASFTSSHVLRAPRC